MTCIEQVCHALTVLEAAGCDPNGLLSISLVSGRPNALIDMRSFEALAVGHDLPVNFHLTPRSTHWETELDGVDLVAVDLLGSGA